MFSYVQELVGGSTNQGHKNNQGLFEILGPSQTREGQIGGKKDSYKALQTVLEQQKKLSKRWGRGGSSRSSFNSSAVGGLDLLLGEEVGYGLAGIQEEVEEDQNIDQSNSSTIRDTAYNRELSSKPPQLVVKKGGQYCRQRDDFDIAESVRMSLPGEENSIGDGGRAMSVRSEGFQRSPKYQHLNITKGNEFRSNHNLNSGIKLQAAESSPGLEIGVIPTTIESFLRDLDENGGDLDELPPDFDIKSVVSDTQSMPEFKRSRSPVARPMLFDFDSFDENDPEAIEFLKKYYRRSVGMDTVDNSDASSQSSASQVRNLAQRIERRQQRERLQQQLSAHYANAAKAPKLKREIHVADKVNSFRGTVKGPTAMYVPPTPRKSSYSDINEQNSSS